MSQLVARIMLAIVMFPLGGLGYLIVFLLVADRFPFYSPFFLWRYVFPGATVWVLGALYWWLLWRKSVTWHSRRWAHTGIAALIAAAIGFGVTLLLWDVDSYRACLVGSVTAPVSWIFLSIFVWRETPSERAARVSKRSSNALICPTCGYNLTGLTESRCPECGAKFTIDELVASQPERAMAPLE